MSETVEVAGREGETVKIGRNNLCKRCISFLRKWCYHGHKLQEMLLKRKHFLHCHSKQSE